MSLVEDHVVIVDGLSLYGGYRAERGPAQRVMALA